MPSHQRTVSWHCNANWLQRHHIPLTKTVLLDLASKKTVTDKRENRCNGFAARNQRQNNSPSMTSISRHKHISSLKEKQIATDNVPRCLAAFSEKRCWTTSCASCCDQRPGRSRRLENVCAMLRSVCFVVAICIWKEQQHQENRENHWRHHYWEHEKWQVRQCCSIYCQSDKLMLLATVSLSAVFRVEHSTSWASLAKASSAAVDVQTKPLLKCTTRWGQTHKVPQEQLGSDETLAAVVVDDKRDWKTVGLSPYLFTTSSVPFAAPSSLPPPCASCRW